ncbi:Ig-like domain repeat protein [Candidatus Korobacter versatilis]|nr:Ig-like domain repeat protein [Candidatus Koribacter versatilis]
MLQIALRNIQNAGIMVCAVLLASTPGLAQPMVRSTIQSQSIVSLAPAPRPQGSSLARQATDATFQKAPANFHVFVAAGVGENAGAETLLFNFSAATTLTHIKMANKNFVIVPGGSCYEGNHYNRGESCSLLVRFTPQGPGHRLGFVQMTNSSETAVTSFGLVGNGYAPILSFTPAQITTVTGTATAGTGTINNATNMTVDGGDVLYIADVGNNRIKEIDSSGAIGTISPAFATPQSLAVDSLGIIYSANTAGTYYFSYFAPWATQTAYGTTYAPGSCTPNTPCPLTTVGMSKPANMSIDAYDNLFFEEGTKGAAEMPVANVSGGAGSFNLWYLTNQFVYSNGTPASFAVDASGNLYNSYIYNTANTCFLLEEPLYNAEYSPTANRVAGGVKCGFSGDGGKASGAEISNKIGQIAFDIAGNLYFADAGNQRIRRIDAVTGIISTIAGNGTAGNAGDGGAAVFATISNPTGLAVDSQGQVYFLTNAPTAGPTQSIRKLGTFGYWKWTYQAKGTISAPKIFTVSNTGNQPLALSANAFFGGTNPTDFATDPSTTSCGLTAGATLAAGHTCQVGIVFKPSTVGTRTASLLFPGNTVAGINSIQLVGIGYLGTPTITITSPSGTATKGTTITFTASVTSTPTTKPTGTVTFKVNGTQIGSPITLSSGTASTTFTEATANTYTLTATYNGDVNYPAATATKSLVVSGTIKAGVQVNLAPAVEPASACGPASFAVRVLSASDGTPTGTVELMSGSTSLGSAVLRDGIATLSTTANTRGTQSFFAKYGGDDLHQAGVSASVTKRIPAAGVCNGETRARGFSAVSAIRIR